MKLFLYLVTACVLVIICGCEKSGVESSQSETNGNIVCDNLYQKSDSLEDAVAFMGVPEDRRKASFGSIERYGKLVSVKELEFANRVLRVGRNRNTEDYAALLSGKMREIMAANDKESCLGSRITSIKEGSYLYAECESDASVKCDAKFVAVFSELDKDPSQGSASFYFPETPTHRFVFHHFHKPNNMVIGSTVYAVLEEGNYKIILESLKK